MATQSAPDTNTTPPDPSGQQQIPPPTQQPVLPPQQTPHNKTSTGKIIFIALIALPILILGYRLIVGWLYSPQRIFESKKTTLEAPRAEAETKTEANLDQLETRILADAKVLAPIYGLNNLTSDRRPGRSRQQETIGTLTPVDGEGYFDGCYYHTSYAGDKFNRYPESEKSACILARKRMYIWTGDSKSLEQIVEISAKNSGLDVKDSSPSHFQISEGLYAYVTYLAIPNKSDERKLFAVSNSEDQGWLEVFSNTPMPEVPPTNSSEDNRYLLQLMSAKEYQLLMQRDL